MTTPEATTGATTATEQKLGSTGPMLAVDVGSVNTRVLLFDMVEGQYRLVSRAQSLTTSAPPLGDVSAGLRRCLRTITEQTGRYLMTDQGEIMLGVQGSADILMATASGAPPMKVVLIGLTPEISVVTGRRALASTYAELVETITLADIRTPEQQINAILRPSPNLIFVVGGADYGATGPIERLLETLRLAVSLAPDPKPVILYAGNEMLRPKVKATLGADCALFMVDNVRPSLNTESLEPVQIELGLVYGAYLADNVPGFQEIRDLGVFEGILPTVQGYINMVRFMGESAGNSGVLCVDLGSSTVTVTASINKQLSVAIRPDLGLGHSILSAVKTIGVQRIARWLTFEASDSEIMDYAWNKTLRPSTIPETMRDLEFEYAFAREIIRTAVAGARASWRGVPRNELLPAMKPIIGAGGILAQPLNPGIGSLLLLDALQPVGVAELKLDPYGILPGLGGIAYVEPLAVIHVLESGGLTTLGTAICPDGRTTASEAMQVSVKMQSGRGFEQVVANGALKVIPLPPGQKAQVSIHLARGLKLNGKDRLTLTLDGSAGNLILDGRGRPIIVPQEVDRRARVLNTWYESVRGK